MLSGAGNHLILHTYVIYYINRKLFVWLRYVCCSLYWGVNGRVKGALTAIGYKLRSRYATIASVIDNLALRPFTIVQVDTASNVLNKFQLSSRSVLDKIRLYIISR